MLAFALLATVLWLLGAYLLTRVHRTGRTKDLFPPPLYPGAWPLFGHIPLALRGTQGLSKVIDEIIQYGQKINQYSFTFKLLNLKFYAIADPDDCMTVANICLNKDKFLVSFTRNWLNEGLLFSETHIWKRQRKLLSKAFNQQILDGFQNVFNCQAKLLAEKLENEIGKGPFDHLDTVNTITWDMMYMTIMGLDHKEYETSMKNEYFEAIQRLFEVAVTRTLNCWILYYDFIFKRTHLKKKVIDNLKTIWKITKMTMEKKTSQMENSLMDTEPKDFMDLILQLWKSGEVTEKQAIHNVNTFLLAGHDTIATVMETILVVIGSYPDVQDKVYQELQEILGDTDTNVQKQHIGQLKYTEAVIKEALRLYTPAPITIRRIDQDVQLKNSILQAGGTVILGHKILNRHYIWGPDVDKFRPERWLNRETLPENAFGSFSIGRRNCIGINYSMMSIKTFLAHTLRRCRLTADISKTEFKFNITLKPVSGHLLTIEKRLN